MFGTRVAHCKLCSPAGVSSHRALLRTLAPALTRRRMGVNHHTRGRRVGSLNSKARVGSLDSKARLGSLSSSNSRRPVPRFVSHGTRASAGLRVGVGFPAVVCSRRGCLLAPRDDARVR